MCRVVDDLLPIVGAVAGSFIPGLGTAAGAALGGAIGGGIGNYAQTHTLGGALEGAATGGVGGYFGGGSLANVLTGLGENAGTAGLSTAFDTGLASATSPATLGSLEGAAGGSALFGPAAGTGTAIGGASNALGGAGLGIAGSDALSGVTGNPQFLGALGGSPGAGGLGASGGGIQSATDLAGAQAATGNPLSPSAGNTPNATMGTMSNSTPAAGISGNPQSPLPNSLEAAQGTSPSPVMADTGTSLEGTQAVQPQQPSLSALYGPASTAQGSPMGAAIGQQGASLGQEASPMNFTGALGEGATTGASTVNPTDLMQLFQQSQANPWMKLLQTGYGAYQQHAQQQAQNAYANQINEMFSPNSPYAQQMRQSLARSDAAAGRNSQYGTRDVQLAAALTQARANALGNQNYYRAATATPGANMLNGLFANFGTNQGFDQLRQLGTAGFNGLQNLFGG